jgi:sugar/nucleoside kinase (ribokinase family)
VDLFHPSAEEGLFMAQPDKWERLHRQAGNAELIDFLQAEDFSELAEKFIQWGAGMVTLKSGHRGFYFRSSGRDRLSSLGAATPASLEEWSSRELWMPAYKISHIASATGAGDCSLAGFIAAFLYGQSPERSIAAANALGYQNLQALDATSGIQDWETTRKIMEDQSLPRVSPLEGKGWRFDAGASICHGPGDKQ